MFYYASILVHITFMFCILSYHCVLANCCCAVTGGPLSDRCSRKSIPQPGSFVATNKSSSRRISEGAVRLRHQWLQMCRFPIFLRSIRPTGHQTDQEGHRSMSPRMGQHESYHRLRQRRLPHSGRGHPMLHADRSPGRGDSNLVSRVLPVSELNYARTNL